MNPNASITIFSISSTVILSLVYFFILEKIKVKEDAISTQQVIKSFALRKISGFVIFGLLPASLAWKCFNINISEYGFTLGSSLQLWHWITIAAIFFLLLNLINSKNSELRNTYPEMRLKSWNVQMILLVAMGWMVYLTGYEFLFRGLMLTSCYNAFGYWPAIVINLALYSALHLPKGLKEATAAIPFGLLICYLTLESGSIFPAILIHSVQAISCELLCLWRNPEMNFQPLKNEQP